MSRARKTAVPISGLDEFQHVLADFRSLSGLVTKAGAGLPLADYLSKLGPPWPVPGWVPVITVIAELIVLICVFHFWYGLPQKTLGTRFRWTLLLLCLSFVMYAVLSDVYLFSPGSDNTRIVLGCRLQPAVAHVISPTYSVYDALKGNEYDPYGVYQPWSITFMGLVLLLLWLVMFSSLVAVIGVFVMYERRRPVDSTATVHAPSATTEPEDASPRR